MRKLICSKCMEVFHNPEREACSSCGADCYDFSNDDEYLKRESARVIEARAEAGLDGLVGGLSCVIINTEPDRLPAAVAEMLRFTGFELDDAFEDDDFTTCVLKTPGSADILVRSRKGDNPFSVVDTHPKSGHVPNTRLETFVFEVPHIDKYVSIQQSRGVNFITEGVVRADNHSFIQTIPSSFTDISIGYIKWHRPDGDYRTASARSVELQLTKPDDPVLRNIKELDHAAIRVEARDRDAAILEFMSLTNYNFEFSIYVKVFNSITNVARLAGATYAMVFTSGIFPFKDLETSGPTEKFIHNYGRRVHHIAFRTENIEDTFEALKKGGMEFLLELVGSEDEGLKQTFSAPSEHTLLVNEYIHRYGDFDGFFSRGNVTLLTGATENQ